MLAEILAQIRGQHPLVHCITNYVTANDCANLLLACGASPIMADAPEETAEVTALCGGLALNMGTPSPRRLQAMLLAGAQATRQGIPVVLDPVGTGSSKLRMEAAQSMLEQLCFSIIRGNAAEIGALARGTAAKRGVDTDRGMDSAIEDASLLARRHNTVVILTGTEDIVTDGSTLYRVHNGHAMMRSVTGTGCQLTALAAACVAANPDRPLTSALTAACAMGLAGEIAYRRLGSMDGNATYRNFIIDAIFHLTPEALEKGASYEILS